MTTHLKAYSEYLECRDSKLGHDLLVELVQRPGFGAFMADMDALSRQWACGHSEVVSRLLQEANEGKDPRCYLPGAPAPNAAASVIQLYMASHQAIAEDGKVRRQ